MANSDKDILITPNIGSTTASSKIGYVGADANGSDAISVQPLFDGSKTTLSFEGSSGQLFSIVNDLTSNPIFSVNDISGIPSIEIDADGDIRLAQFGGDLSIGGSSSDEKLHVIGNLKLEQTSNVDSYIRLNPNSASLGSTYRWDIIANNSASNYDLHINKGTDTYLAITNSVGQEGGRIGLGTTSPESNIHILDNNNNSGSLLTTGTTADFAQIRVENDSATNNSHASLFFRADTADAKIAFLRKSATSNDGDLVFIVDDASAGAAVERLRIVGESGNIGFTNSSPMARLDLGTAASTDNVMAVLARQASPGDTNFRLTAGTGDGTSVYNEFFKIGISYINTQNAFINFHRGGNTTGGFLTFSVSDDTEAARINASGRLLVNTTDDTLLSSLFAGTTYIKGRFGEDPLIAVTDSGTANAAAGVFHQSSSAPGFPALVVNANSNADNTPIISARTNVNNTTGTGGTEVFKVTGQGALTITGQLTASTVNTGQGATEVHLMNQNVRTTDSPTFAGLTLNGLMLINEGNTFTNLQIKSDRTSGNIGGLDFVDSTGAVKGQVYGRVDGHVLINSGGQTEAVNIDADQNTSFSGNVTIKGNATPTLFFNGDSDTTVDMAIKATPESLDFYEPEDANKLHMRITDDAGVNAVFGLRTGAGDGTMRISAAGQFSGSLATAVTGTTHASTDNTTKVATTAYVTTAIGNLIDGAPTALNTLNELAAALDDNANILDSFLPLAGGTMSGNITMNGNQIVSTRSTIGHVGSGTATLANAGFLAGSTTTGIGIDSNEIVKVGGDEFYIGNHGGGTLSFTTGNGVRRLSINSSGAFDFLHHTLDSVEWIKLKDADDADTLILDNDSGRGRIRFYRDGATAYGQIMHDGADLTISSTVGAVKVADKLEVFNGGVGTSNAASGIAEFSGSSFGGVVEALSLVNSATASLGNGTQINFHNAGNYSPTGVIKVTQASDAGVTTDSEMEFQTYSGTIKTALVLDHNQDARFYNHVGIGELPDQLFHPQHTAANELIVYSRRYNDTNAKPILAITESQMGGMTSTGLVIGNHNRDIHIGPVFATPAIDTTSQIGIRIRASDGKVGIGTQDPAQKLDVNGDARIRGTSGKLYFDTAGSAGSNYVGTINDYEAILYSGRGSAGHVVAGNSSIRLGFGSAATAAQAKLYIASTGNVGLGTSSPQQKLHVEGNIYMGPNNTPNIIHSGAPITLSSDGDVFVVADSNDTSAAAPAGHIYFGGGSLTDTDSNQDFTVQEYSGGSTAYSPRLTYGKFNGASGNLELTNSLVADGSVQAKAHGGWSVNSSLTAYFQDNIVQLTRTGSSYLQAQYGNKTYTDSKISVEFKTTNSSHFGIFFHGQADPHDNSYQVIVRGVTHDDVRVQERNAGSQSYKLPNTTGTGVSTGINHDDGNWHTLEVTIIDDRVIATIDGTTYIDADYADASFTSGTVGLMSYDNTVYWRNFKAEDIRASAQVFPASFALDASYYSLGDRYIELYNDVTNTSGTLVQPDNGNTWLNADGGKDLWLNWASKNSRTSYADLNVGNGNLGGAIFRVDGTSGKVGVNISGTPSEKFQVNDGNILIEGLQNSNTRGLYIKHTGQTGNVAGFVQDASNAHVRLYTTERNLRIEAGAGGSTGGDEKLQFYTNSGLAMSIDTSQKVGIGRADPLALLDISQNMTNGSTSAFTSPHLRLTAENTVDTTGFVGMTFATSSSNNYGWSYGALREGNGIGRMVWRFHADSAGGVEKMRLTDEGYLGIGIADPLKPLHVESSGTGNGIYMSIGTGGRNHLYSDGTWNYYKGLSGNAHRFTTTGGADTVINNDGNLGVDTLSPWSRIQSGGHTFTGANGMYANSRVGISNHGALTGMMLASTYNDSTFPEYGLVFVHGPSTSSYNVWSLSPEGPAAGDSLHFIYGDSVSNIHTSTPKVTFDGNGHVGIGTKTPLQKLHVVSGSDQYVAKFEHASGTGYAPGSIVLQAGQSNSRGQGLYHYNTVADDSWFTGVPYSVQSTKWVVAHKADTTFNPDVAQTAHAIFTIDSATDNVGIGTSSPLGALHIKKTGTARIVLDGDSNNVDDTGQRDVEILMLNDGGAGTDPFGGTSSGAHGYRISTQNWSGKTSLSFDEYLNTSGFVSRLHIDEDGFVGIGTGNPTNLLHTISSANEGIFMQGTGPGHWFNFKSGVSDLWSMGAQSGLMGFYNRTDSAYRMVISDAGNMGVGTSGTTARITLADHTTAAGGIMFRSAASSVSLWSASSGNLNTDKSFNIGSRLRLVGGQANSDPDIHFTGAASGTGFSRATNDITFITAATERMRIASTGRVGIGNTANVYKTFQVEWLSNNAVVTTGEGLSGGGDGTGILVKNTSSTANSYANIDFRANNADGRIAYQYKGATNVGDFHFITDGNGTQTSRLIIADGGVITVTNDIQFNGTTYKINPYEQSNYRGGTTTSQSSRRGLNFHHSTGPQMTFWYHASGTGVGNLKIFSNNSGEGDVFQFTPAGAFHAKGDITAYSTTTTSDARLKQNVRDLEGSLDKTLKLRGVKFDWIDESKSKDNLGFIAQEVEEVIPEVVKDITNIDGEEHKVVNYQAVVPVLVEAIKEQQSLINRLEARLNELEKSMEKK